MKIRLIKSFSVFLAINLLTQVIFPTSVYALTSGPSQPEFSSFEPVSTTNIRTPYLSQIEDAEVL